MNIEDSKEYKDFKTYTHKIFWDFKRRDNVKYNFEIILLLTEYSKNISKEHLQLLYKPIFILLVGILECLLYDQLMRVQQHKNEKMGLTEDDIAKLKDVNLPSKLANYADLSQKCNLFGDDGKNLVDRIRCASNIRNRMHMQNIEQVHPLNDQEIWTADNLRKVGDTIKEVFRYICLNHPRYQSETSLPDFPEPWVTIIQSN